jgi:hypothetical protein
MINIAFFILCSAIMDNISSYNSFEKYFIVKEAQTKKSIYGHLSFWFSTHAWKNKYAMKEWMMSLGISKKISTWLAKDVLVVFTDAWHFFKAIGILAIVEPYVSLFSEQYQINYLITYILVFILSGQLFNVLFYSFKKLGE